jgi:uncharacterized membrane protein/protein-disulfide isomerase
LTAEKEMNHCCRNWPWWRIVMTGLMSLALALSAYLSWHYLVGGTVIGCSGGSSCEQVLSGRWSTIGGILPVSGLALGAYMAMLIASFFIGPTTPAPVRRLAWSAMILLIGCAAGSAVWFTVLQKWVIGSFCPYCMTAHITGLVLATLILWKAPRQFLDASTPPQRVIGYRPTIGLAMTGVALAGIMALCQALITPPATYKGGEAQSTLPAIDSHAAPMIGSPDAPYIVDLLFDYKCPHCQQLHFMLEEVVRRYNGKLAFAICPSPLNPQCNPYVPREVPEFTNSCELAKTGLAVWLAKREAFPAFELYMFTMESGDRWVPRALEDARAKALELVGQAKFDAALANPWIDQYLQKSIRIYGSAGGTAIPKLIYNSRWVTPKPNDVEDLIAILQESLQLPAP